jgi:hypothetical protein
VADRLRTEAGRVESKLRLLDDRAACEQDLLGLGRRLAEADGPRPGTAGELVGPLAAPRLRPPLSPGDGAWVRAQGELGTQAAARRDAIGRIEELARRIDDRRRELGETLVRSGETGVGPDEGLLALLARAEGVVEHIKAVAAERRQWEEGLARLEAELPAAREEGRRPRRT